MEKALNDEVAKNLGVALLNTVNRWFFGKKLVFTYETISGEIEEITITKKELFDYVLKKIPR